MAGLMLGVEFLKTCCVVVCLLPLNNLVLIIGRLGLKRAHLEPIHARKWMWIICTR